MERLSIALEKVADNRERLVAVEIRVSNVDISVTDLKKTVETVLSSNQIQDVQIARLDMVKAAALFLAGAIISILGPVLLKKFGF